MSAHLESATHFKSISKSGPLILCMIFYATTYNTALADESRSATNAPPTQQITVDSVNLAGNMFLSKFASTAEKEREQTMFYLLGVQDATEGVAWCDYKTIKTITLREHVYEYFRTLPKERLDERASTLIQEALTKLFPCGTE